MAVNIHREQRLESASSPRAARVLICLVAVLSVADAGCAALRYGRTAEAKIAAARQLSLQGLDSQQRGHWAEAETSFAAAVGKCPQDERARAGYADSLWRRGAYQEAILQQEEAVRLSGHDPARHVQLGNMYLAVGDLTRASEQADQAISFDPQLAAAWALQGNIQRAEGRRSAALASFHRAVTQQHPFPEVQVAMAEIYQEENRPSRSLATLQDLVASFPPGQAPAELIVRESRALQALGRHQDAARTLAVVANRGNPSADLLAELARAQALAGEIAAARQSLAAALEREPNHAAGLALQAELGSAGGAIAALSKAGRLAQ